MAKRKLEAEADADSLEVLPTEVGSGHGIRKCFEALFRWPEIFAQRLQAAAPRALRKVLEKYRQGLFLSSNYSGVGTAEIVCEFIQTAVKDQVQCSQSSSGSDVGLVCISATDSLADCRRVLLSYVSSPPNCVFGSLEERAPAELVNNLRSMQDSCLSEAHNAHAEGVRDAYTSWGRFFMEEACQVIRESADKAGVAPLVWCYRHQSNCHFSRRHLRTDSGWTLEVAGVSCIDWSLLGNQLGWLGPTCISFLLWAREQHVFRPDITVIENVDNFDDHVLKMLFPKHTITVFGLLPSQFGVPATRSRKYIVMLSEDCCWNPALRDPISLLRHLFMQDEQWGSAVEFCSAPSAMVDRFHAHLAVQRGFPALGPHGQPWLAKHVTAPGMLKRIRAWEALVRASHNLRRTEVGNFWMNATQNADRSPCAKLIPALITNSHIWSMERQRFLLVAEHFEVQGFAMFDRASVPNKFMCPFRQLVFEDVQCQETFSQARPQAVNMPQATDNENSAASSVSASARSEQIMEPQRSLRLRHMAGNAMNMQCLASVLMMVLAFVEKKDSV